MKKKFKDTKIGKVLLSPLIKNTLKSLPIVGGFASNILDEVKGDGKGEIVSESGGLNLKDPTQLIGAVVTLVLLYLAMKGKISFQEAEQAKDFIIR